MHPEDKNNHLYDGWFYHQFIDPALAGIRRRVAKLVPADASVVDVGCGTGDQLLHISGQISTGLGIELSETMVRAARSRASGLNLDHIEFQHQDARDLSALPDLSFDIAMCSMMIHEMPSSSRLPVLKEMIRLGQQLILVDWICPQSSTWKRWSTHTIEFFAGWQHYAGYRSFMSEGGIPKLLEQTDLEVIETQITSKGTIQLWICQLS